MGSVTHLEHEDTAAAHSHTAPPFPALPPSISYLSRYFPPTSLLPSGQIITEDAVCSAFLTNGGEDQPFSAALAPTIQQKQGKLLETMNS